MVMIDVAQAQEAQSYSNEGSWASYFGTALYPSRLAEHEFIYFDYKDYDMITSITRAEIDAFLAVRCELSKLTMADPFAMNVEVSEPLPYEEYDIV